MEGAGRAECPEVRTKTKVYVPTMEEWKAHRLTHLPYRSWCPECVAGKGTDDAHRRRHGVESTQSPEFHLDYVFVRNVAGGDHAKVLVGKERKTQCFIAHVVPSKGAGAEWVARQLTNDI